MDTMTHVLAGAVIGKAIEDDKIGNWGTIAGLAVGFFPDTDYALGLFSRQFYFQYHRNFTHSLLLIPLYALVLSWLLTKLSRRPFLWSFYRICLPVLVSHVALDLFTSYGTMVFSPFFGHRYSWDFVFFVDLIFSGILLIPWLVSLFWKSKARWIARGSLACLGLYVLFCWTQHHRALNLAKGFADTLGEEIVEVASLPQPLSPFRWCNYVGTKNSIYQGFVDFRSKQSPRAGMDSLETLFHASSFFQRLGFSDRLYQLPTKVTYRAWQKQDGSPWVEKALLTEGARFYYWFARFPIAKTVPSNNGTHRVEFMDVRFLFPGIRMPFLYYIEFDDSGRIQSEGFSGDGKR